MSDEDFYIVKRSDSSTKLFFIVSMLFTLSESYFLYKIRG